MASLSAAIDNLSSSLEEHLALAALVQCALAALALRLLRRAGLDGRRSILRASLWLGALLVASVASASLTSNLFFAMNMVALALFAQGPIIAAYLATRLDHQRAKASWSLVALALVAVALDAFVIEPTQLTVRRVVIESTKLRRPLRVVVLADLQFDRLDEHTRSALRRAMDERPDLLLLPGDYVQRPRMRGGDAVRREANAYLRSLRFGASLGLYAVEGNVEWEPGWQTLFDGINAHVFNTLGRHETDELVVTGMSLRESFTRSLTIPRETKFHIAVGHAPDFALGDVGADLLVAGHTHGGQVQLPFIGPLLTLSAVPREWAAGNREITLSEGRTLVVSRGIGMERGSAPRVRFRCRPELVVIELRPR
jgi:predicted MPP superfamily phosphohydrolase